MFNFEKLNLRKRLGLLVLVPIILTIIFGVVALNALEKNEKTLHDITIGSNRSALAGSMLITVLGKVREPMIDMNANKITWSDGRKTFKQSRIDITEQYEKFKQNIADEHLKTDKYILAINKAMPKFLTAFDSLIKIAKTENKQHLGLFIREEMHEFFSPLVKSLKQYQGKNSKIITQQVKQSVQASTQDRHTFIGILLLNLFLLTLLGYLVFRSISKQTKALTSTIDELNKGNKTARITIAGKHELAQLGLALNQLLDERDVTEINIQKENEVLNTSVFSLLESVADLSERNLTVRATVTEDATGPLADAINQLAMDTTDVLKKVRNIALTVEQTSQTVEKHTTVVKELAESERSEAEQTSEVVGYLIERLNQISTTSISANTIANETTEATEKAYQSVSKTVDSMTSIRETVQETGKRIKRLGERSQEITHIIDLINTIAERTTILALNASMQSLSAGEAGKGFSVIAKEIQQLAESSRESTEQIANLIKNIQQETRTTMVTMDHTIEQVITGSSLAEKASEQMQLTLNATNKLTHSVESIAQASKEQVAISNRLKTRASDILKATRSTGEKMESLAELTKSMVRNAQSLVQSVNVFKLEKHNTKLIPKNKTKTAKAKQLVSNG